MDTREAFVSAIASTGAVVKAIRSDQLADSTPCAEWDVRSLLNHTVGGLWLAASTFAGSAPRYPMELGGLPAVDLVGGDAAGAYADAAAAALAATEAESSFTVVHDTPFGELPGKYLAGLAILDIHVHGWDLAHATGQPAGLDPDVSVYARAFAHESGVDNARATRFAAAVPVPAEAPPLDQLVGFLGRQP